MSKTTTEETSRLLAENARRLRRKHRRHDPVSGEGCVGDRFRVTLRGLSLAVRTLWLPVEMRELPAVRLLEGAKGDLRTAVRRARGGGNAPVTEEEMGAFLFALSESRLRYDYEWFAVSHQTIREKESGRRIRFVLNPPQQRLVSELERQRKAGRQIRVMVLKARQMGFSTVVQMYMEWIQLCLCRNWNSVVCAHELSQAAKVRSMYEECLLGMPPIEGVKMSYAPYAGTQSTKQVPERGCRITIGTALRPDSVRGEDVKMVHFSEEAFYPTTAANNPGLLETSIIASIPNVPRSLIVRESTANGVGGFFHDQWLRSKAGETGYTPFFAPWYELPVYEEPIEGAYHVPGRREKRRGSRRDFVRSLTERERSLFASNEGVTLENLNWYRGKYNSLTDPSKMAQEFPSDDVEAFLNSGTPVFRAEEVEALRAGCRAPKAVGRLRAEGDPQLALTDPKERSRVLKGLTFVAEPEALEAVRSGTPAERLRGGLGRLQVWAEPSAGPRLRDRYVVAFDPQRGLSEGADYGVVKVFDREPMLRGEGAEVAALFYAHFDKDVTAWMATQVAEWYGRALLVIESNTYDSSYRADDGEFIFDMIAREYPNLYSRTPKKDTIREGHPVRYGWQTNRNTKPLLVNNYIALLREGAYVERDGGTLDEARVYETKADGSMGAAAGYHDDRLMATMMGLYVAYELPPPRAITPKPTIGRKHITIR